VPTYPLLKLSDVIVVRHASSSTRLKTARYHLARLVRASPSLSAARRTRAAGVGRRRQMLAANTLCPDCKIDVY
jgi:hypothetical protein